MTDVVSVDDLSFALTEAPSAIAACYAEHGAAVVRGLSAAHVQMVLVDIEAQLAEARACLAEARRTEEGLWTENGGLFIPAPEGSAQQQQVMMPGLTYRRSAAFFRAAIDADVLAIIQAILGPNVELMDDGQVLYKEPVGGHAKRLHQDAAYFEHAHAGPVAVLNYTVPTDYRRGCLHVVPGSHRLGLLDHGDTDSHLGLDPDQWPLQRALAIEGEPGDAIFFSQFTIHGSPPNQSTGPRPVFIHRYRHPADFIRVEATTAANRASATVASHKHDGGGLMVCGRRSHPGG